MEEDILSKYGLSEKTKDYMINSFAKIGMPDPFPQNKEMMTTEEDKDLLDEVIANYDVYVYPDWKNDPYQSPKRIWIPNKAVMLKMMRSCIGIKNPEDLWTNCET